MQYYMQLGLDKEPFSNSPDPNFLHLSSQHVECLQQLEISVRLRRGLNVVIGKVGTGKTTLLRQLIRHLGADESMRVHLVLDPEFPSSRAFLKLICAQLTGKRPDPALSDWGLKERIKKELFRLGVEQNRVVVLIIDEGQKITPECLEILRELLNYETNSSKLLQIVLFAQEELEPVMARMHNFVDRINCRLHLGALSRAETRDMIEFRLDQALPPGKPLPHLFSNGAVRQIHQATEGYPRKVVRLCHKAVLEMLVAGKNRITARMVRDLLRQEGRDTGMAFRWAVAAASVILLLAGAAGLVRYVPPVRQAFHGLAQAMAATEPVAGQAALPGEHEPVAPDVRVSEAAIAATVESDALEPESLTPAATLSETALPEAGTPMAGASQKAAPEIGKASAQKTATLAGMPDSLGAIRLLPLENVSEVIREVYGVYDGWHLDLVAGANKHLHNLERVPVGSRVVMPVRADLAGRIPDWAWWVNLDTARDLEKAYVLVRKYRYFGLSTRILPVWTERDGLAFRVVLAGPYGRQEEARTDLDRLPLSLQASAQLWRAGDAGCVVLGSMSQADRKALDMPVPDGSDGATPAS